MDSNAHIIANWEYKHGPIPKGYQFWGNLIIENGKISLLLKGGSASIYTLDQWIVQMSIGAGRLFGPPVKVKGWTVEKLEKANAVAIYSKD